MEILLIIILGAIFVLHVAALVKRLRAGTNAKWWIHILLEFLSAAGAVGLAFLFDGIRGSGFMPGMSYIMEFFYCLVAAAAYLILLLVSLCAMLIQKAGRKT